MFSMGVPPLGPSPPGYGSEWVALWPAEPFRRTTTCPEEPTEANPTGTLTEEADQPPPNREELTSPVPVKPEPVGRVTQGHR